MRRPEVVAAYLGQAMDAAPIADATACAARPELAHA